MKDITCLAEGILYHADSSITGLNLNEIIVGGTGCGKSFSNAYSRLLHTHKSSVVLSRHTGKSAEEIDEATAFDNFMNAEEAITFGIVDEIKNVI